MIAMEGGYGGSMMVGGSMMKHVMAASNSFSTLE
jgi:hypothetical protein